MFCFSVMESAFVSSKNAVIEANKGHLHCYTETSIGPLHDPVTWYGINYTWTQVAQCRDFQNKGTRTSPARLSFVLEVVPLRILRLSVIYSVPCDRIVRRAYYDVQFEFCPPLHSTREGDTPRNIW